MPVPSVCMCHEEVITRGWTSWTPGRVNASKNGLRLVEHLTCDSPQNSCSDDESNLKIAGKPICDDWSPSSNFSYFIVNHGNSKIVPFPAMCAIVWACWYWEDDYPGPDETYSVHKRQHLVGCFKPRDPHPYCWFFIPKKTLKLGSSHFEKTPILDLLALLLSYITTEIIKSKPSNPTPEALQSW